MGGQWGVVKGNFTRPKIRLKKIDQSSEPHDFLITILNQTRHYIHSGAECVKKIENNKIEWLMGGQWGVVKGNFTRPKIKLKKIDQSSEPHDILITILSQTR